MRAGESFCDFRFHYKSVFKLACLTWKNKSRSKLWQFRKWRAEIQDTLHRLTGSAKLLLTSRMFSSKCIRWSAHLWPNSNYFTKIQCSHKMVAMTIPSSKTYICCSTTSIGDLPTWLQYRSSRDKCHHHLTESSFLKHTCRPMIPERDVLASFGREASARLKQVPAA